ncbi:MAG: 50S ribosomal protein L25/general stress protein Ctc [Spirochaetia bacterium]|nr:50S ribosomal protein L25/general stress protein Ctc [Spirochaetia bacterium]
MDDKVLSAIKRTESGTGASRRLRREGQIPAVIYGKETPVHISIDAKEFKTKIKNISESGLLTIKIGKKSFTVLIKDFQENPLKYELKHIDFFEITKGEKLHTSVSIILLHAESAVGIRLGGVLEQVLHEVEIECLPENIPDNIICDISELGLNESLHIENISIPENVKILTDPHRTIVAITSLKEEKAEEESEEESTEVEVIGAAELKGE